MLEDQQERALRAARNYSGNSHGSMSLSSSSSTTSSQGEKYLKYKSAQTSHPNFSQLFSKGVSDGSKSTLLMSSIWICTIFTSFSK